MFQGFEFFDFYSFNSSDNTSVDPKIWNYE